MFKRRIYGVIIGILALALPALAVDAAINLEDSGPSTKLVKQVRPAYPPDAKAAGIQGKVQLEVVVQKDGKVKEVHVLSGDEALAEAAVAAVEKWEWEPVVKEGQPVSFIEKVCVNFTLAK